MLQIKPRPSHSKGANRVPTMAHVDISNCIGFSRTAQNQCSVSARSGAVVDCEVLEKRVVIEVGRRARECIARVDGLEHVTIAIHRNDSVVDSAFTPNM